MKGFLGGFGRGELGAFGEAPIKAFVDAALDEARKLENALRSLKTERSVAVLHYSPVADTVEGEPLEIYPFLGCSRLADAIDRFDNVAAVVHGHAHRGTPSRARRRAARRSTIARRWWSRPSRAGPTRSSRSSGAAARRGGRRAAGGARGSSRAAVSIVSSARRAAT